MTLKMFKEFTVARLHAAVDRMLKFRRRTADNFQAVRDFRHSYSGPPADALRLHRINLCAALTALAFVATSCATYTHEVTGLQRVSLQAGSQPGQYTSLAAKDSLRFIVVGDFGSGNEKQTTLAMEMRKQCDLAGGCDFALIVGNNIYAGARSDGDFEQKFESPSNAFGHFDFWLVPGDHDWSSAGSIQREINHTTTSERWRMPFNHFAVPGLPDWVHVYGVDTTIFEQAYNRNDLALIANRNAQLLAARNELCGKDGWKLLFGHHAIYSGGEHGMPNGILKEQQATIEPLIQACHIQVYFAGHDHDQELIRASGFLQIVQGAGGENTRSVKDTSAGERRSEKRSVEFGFAIVDLDRQSMRLRFFDCGRKTITACTAQEVAVLQP